MANHDRLIPGQTVAWQGRSWIVLDLPAIDRAVLRDTADGRTESAPTVEIRPVAAAAEQTARQDLMLIPDEDWNEAWRRYQVIQPLVEKGPYRRTARDAEAVAKQAGKNVATVYRWLSRYEETGLVSSLLRPRRRDVGLSRLEPEVAKVLDETIQTFYLTAQRHSPAETCAEVQRRCIAAGLMPPHPNTVRIRIGHLSQKMQVAKRMGSKAARERFEPIKGKFPGADYPLAVVQIDHTPVDLILVDDEHRRPIGRPYLTLAIDVCTRMIAGFYISLDPPGALSAGLCIVNAVLPKDMTLARMEIATPWPIWGKMQKIHVDNAKEFRGAMLERACREHGIILEYRPKGTPNYGGHVERAFRTFMSKTHGVSGTTFSNVQEKADYDSEGKAAMTLAEFERWFTIFVVEVYHQKAHKGISKIPPIRAYEQAVCGTDGRPGIGLPMRVADEQKFRLDFTPYVERTIQEYGVVIDNIHYYSDVMRHWIHARDPDNPKLKRKFVFARDPRDISVVYFLDPESRIYSPVPYRDTTRPGISLWELNAALKRLAEDESVQPNEELIFEGIRKMREIERQAVDKTKAARRSMQRRKAWTGARKAAAPEPVATDIPASDYPGGEVLPFDDIVEPE
ncbi:putative transposase [Sulfuritortus calidifontis]|uniref:Putative transposase n=1 Tax=Sulfuritortus calidifontis TaxID=1914471 RepID=A0A4R3JVN7_9PROT|nr:Mu transposase C-terminal domain-containing protein [Sulfuritortus calidifontis]TCS72151.1 putative transposase [Sulfuritortus calidifontis]